MPAVNENGLAHVSVQIHDDGGTASGGVDTSAIQTFTITLTLVNQAPTFTEGVDQSVLEDAGPQVLGGWASAISSGPGDPVQGLTFTVTNDNNALFSVSGQPAISSIGVLTYTTAANANGSATVSVTLSDDGGVASGGHDTSPTQTFTISVTPVNDPPTFIKGANISLPEEPSPAVHTVVGWAHGFNPGPADESSQTLVGYHVVSNTGSALFSVQPAINTSGNLTYTLAINRTGVATVGVTVQDNGGVANSGIDTSAVQTFTITVTGVDHPPAAVNDISGVPPFLGAPPFPFIIQGSGSTSLDVLANDSDPDLDTISIVGVCLSPPHCPTTIQTPHGHVAVAANKKSLTYTTSGSYFGSDQFEYEITDGRGQVAYGTVLLTVLKDTFGPVATAPKIWTTSATSSTVTILLHWSGTDVGFGVKYYQLQESRNGASYVSVTVPVGATSVSRAVSRGSTYTYRVRGVDKVGNVGAWVGSLTFKPNLVPTALPSRRTSHFSLTVPASTAPALPASTAPALPASTAPASPTRSKSTGFVIQP